MSYDTLSITLYAGALPQRVCTRRPKGTNETCPVQVLEQWVTAPKITTGPIFRPVNRYGTVDKKALSGLAVPRIVKEWLTRAGIDAKDYSGHSLRAGLVTVAAMAGVSERIIMLQTGLP